MIRIQNFKDATDYFGDNNSRKRNLKDINVERIPLKDERILFRDKVYVVAMVVTDLDEGSVTVCVEAVQ